MDIDEKIINKVKNLMQEENVKLIESRKIMYYI